MMAAVDMYVRQARRVLAAALSVAVCEGARATAGGARASEPKRCAVGSTGGGGQNTIANCRCHGSNARGRGPDRETKRCRVPDELRAEIIDPHRSVHCALVSQSWYVPYGSNLSPSVQNVLIPKCENIENPPTAASVPAIHSSCRGVGTGKVWLGPGPSQPETWPGHADGSGVLVRWKQSRGWSGRTVPLQVVCDVSCAQRAGDGGERGGR